jgi:hypothetical protein
MHSSSALKTTVKPLKYRYRYQIRPEPRVTVLLKSLNENGQRSSFCHIEGKQRQQTCSTCIKDQQVWQHVPRQSALRQAQLSSDWFAGRLRSSA